MIREPEGSATELGSSFALSKSALMKALLVLGVAFAVCVLLIALVLLCVRLCPKGCARIQRLCSRIKNMLMFNSLLRYYIMTFLSTAIGCSMQLRRWIQNRDHASSAETIVALLTLVGMLALTGVLTKLLIANKAKLKDTTFRQKYGTLYTPCDISKGAWPLVHTTLFCLRRFAVALSVALLLEHSLVQITIAIVGSSVLLLWHFMVWPMENTR